MNQYTSTSNLGKVAECFANCCENLCFVRFDEFSGLKDLLNDIGKPHVEKICFESRSV